MTKGKKLVQAAVEFVEEVFAGQTRKGPEKKLKMAHMTEVLDLVRRAGGSFIEQQAAILHNAIEETHGPKDEMRREILHRFGKDVLLIVEEVTDPEEFKLLPARERKTAQARRIAPGSDSSKRIKIADQISNIREMIDNPPEGWSAEKCADYLSGALRVVNACRDASPALAVLFLEVYQEAVTKFPQPLDK